MIFLIFSVFRAIRFGSVSGSVVLYVIVKGAFGCNLEASDSVQNGVDLELQSDSEATVRLNSSST